MMRFVDNVPLDGVRVREDGSLVTDARVARTGIQLYLGTEVKRPETKYVRVYRPGEEVFSEDSVRTLAHRPVTMGHPPEMVDSTNWKKFAVGQTGDEIVGEKIYLRVPLMVSDGGAVERIQDGEQELSCGYVCQLDWTPGETPEGEKYDAIQRDIRYNHVAVVQRGRAGKNVRIGAADGDAVGCEWGTAPVLETVSDEEGGTSMPDNLTTVTVDGLTISVTDQGAQVIGRLQEALTASQAAMTQATDAHAAEVADRDKQISDRDTTIGELQAQIKKLEDAQMDTAAIDARVAERAQLVSLARAVDESIKTDGVTDADIRRSVCAAKLGEDLVKDASEDQISGMFRVVAKDVKPADPFAAAVKGGTATVGDSAAQADEARTQMLQSLSDGWKQPSVNVQQ